MIKYLVNQDGEVTPLTSTDIIQGSSLVNTVGFYFERLRAEDDSAVLNIELPNGTVLTRELQYDGVMAYNEVDCAFYEYTIDNLATIVARENVGSNLTLSVTITNGSTIYQTENGTIHINASVQGNTYVDITDSQYLDLVKTDQNMQSKISTNTTDIETVQSDVSSIETSVSSLETRVTQNETDIASADTRLDDIEAELAGIEGDDSTLTTRVSTLESEMDTAQADIASAESNITTLQSDVNSVETSVSSLNTRVTTAESDIDTAQTDISELETSVTSLNTRVTQNETDIETLQSEVVDYNDLTNKPIIESDISTLTPTENTYYLHTGTTDTYTQGVIYFYDGSTYTAVTGGSSGGVADVKIGSDSIVTNGVANIPNASTSQAGLVSTGYQEWTGTKRGTTFAATYVESDTLYAFDILGRGQALDLTVDSSLLYGVSVKVNKTSTPAHVWLTPYADNSAGYKTSLGSETKTFTDLYLTDKIIKKDTNTTYNCGLPSYNGKLMSMPETWTTGTTPTAMLPDSGTYLIVVEDSYTSNIDGETVTKNYNVPVIINWDGETTTISQKWNDYGGTYERYLRIDEQLGQINVLTNEQLSYPLALTIYVKKIGD